MIRLIQRRLVIPRGDTGTIVIPALANANGQGVAVFSIIDPITQTLVFQKQVEANNNILEINLAHNDTVNLPVGKYVWDIKYYINPTYVENKVVNGEEIDSYYAAFDLPVCEIRQTGDNLLMNANTPSATLAPNQLDIITNALNALATAVQQTNSNVTHYPTIINNIWYVWDATTNEYVSTGVNASPQALTTEDLQNIIGGTADA